MTDKSDIEALACDIYNAHRTERIIAGAKNVASWWGMDARHREHWMKVARRLQPAQVPDGWCFEASADRVYVTAPGGKTECVFRRIGTESGHWGWGFDLCASLAAPQPEAAQTAGETHSDNAKDAARFRWLRDHAINTEGRNGSPWCVYGLDLGDCTPAFGAELVAMVDDAMANGIVCSPVPVESLGRDEPEPAPSAPADVEALHPSTLKWLDEHIETAEAMTDDDDREGQRDLIHWQRLQRFARRLSGAQQAGGGKGGA